MRLCDARLDAETKRELVELEQAHAIHTPSLWFDAQAVRSNIDAMIARLGDPNRWRPHIKTHKCKKVLRIALQRGVRHFKCATLDEFALLLELAQESQESIDILYCYPLIAESWRAAQVLARKSATAQLTWLIESPQHLNELLDHRLDDSLPLRLALDIDVGMQRSGSTPEEWSCFLENRYRQLQKHCEVVALHGYEGHLRWGQQREAFRIYDRLLQLHAAPALKTHEVELCSSGSHSYVHALSHAGLSKLGRAAKVSPGTIVLNDLHSAAASADLKLRQAAFVATRVIHSRPGQITLDAGSKAIAPDVQEDVARIVGGQGWRSATQNEEHLVMRNIDPTAQLAFGELLWLVPAHICTTVNLYDQALLFGPQKRLERCALARGHRWPVPH